MKCSYFFVLIATAGSFFMNWTATAQDQDVVAGLGLEESAAPMREMKGWETPRKIVVLAENAARIAPFQDVAPSVTVVGARDPREAAAHMKDADALISFCSSGLVDAAPQLK